MPFAGGNVPARSAVSTWRPEAGKARLSASPALATAVRLRVVSLRTRTSRSMSASCAVRRLRRACAWASRIRVHASKPTRPAVPTAPASKARDVSGRDAHLNSPLPRRGGNVVLEAVQQAQLPSVAQRGSDGIHRCAKHVAEGCCLACDERQRDAGPQRAFCATDR